MKHAHKYERRTTPKGSIIFKCLTCPHYAQKTQVEGNRAECRYCGKGFLMNKASLQEKPHCGCRNKKKKLEDKKLSDKIDSIFADVLGDD